MHLVPSVMRPKHVVVVEWYMAVAYIALFYSWYAKCCFLIYLRMTQHHNPVQGHFVAMAGGLNPQHLGRESTTLLLSLATHVSL